MSRKILGQQQAVFVNLFPSCVVAYCHMEGFDLWEALESNPRVDTGHRARQGQEGEWPGITQQGHIAEV